MSFRISPMRPSLASILVLVVGSHTHAQCPDPRWLPGQGVPGADLFVNSTIMWDRDGAGPAPALLVVGGGFNVVGTVASRGLAAWNPATGEWLDIAPGLSHPSGFAEIASMAVLNDGRLVVSGAFEEIDGVAADNIAIYDGNAWAPMGDGLSGPDGGIGFAMQTMPNGDLIVGGFFVTAGGVTANGLAKWSGNTWSAIGTGIDIGNFETINAMTLRPNGTLVVGGFFATVDGVPAQSVAQWNGTAWSALPGDGVDGLVDALANMSNGDLVIGGSFLSAGGQPIEHIARLSGSTWSGFASGFGTYVGTILSLPGNQMIAGGASVEAGSTTYNSIALWNGSAWQTMDGGLPYPANANTLTKLPDGRIVLGGEFVNAGGGPNNRLAIWNGTAWDTIGTGINDWIDALQTQPDGSVIASGAFTTIGDQAASLIARWTGSSWQAMPGLRAGFTSGAATMGNGRVVAVGNFDLVSNPEVFMTMAEWGGSAWVDVGSNADRVVHAVVSMPDGTVIMTGEVENIGGVSVNHVVRWDGTSFTSVGDGVGTSGEFGFDLVLMPNNDLVVGGAFSSASGTPTNNIARWNGSTWSAIGEGLDNLVRAVATSTTGQLYAAGYFTASGTTPINAVARWDGTQWHAMGSGLALGEPTSLLVRPNGDVIFGGQFASVGGAFTKNIARWNGTAWSGLGLGLDSGTSPSEYSVAFAVANGPNDQLLAAGQFLRADGETSVNFARYGCEATPCYADCDGGGTLNIDDFICFQTLFAIGSNAADCDASGSLDIDDFICFQTLFALGC